MPRVFVSHSSEDRYRIEHDILPVLHAHSIEFWYSSHDIPSASDWEKEIRSALMNCDWFLVALSAQSIRSDWVQAEVHWALDHRKDHFVSVIIGDCVPSDLHLKLIRYQHVDWRKPKDDNDQKLIEAFGVVFRRERSAVVEFFCRNDSVSETRRFAIYEKGIIGRRVSASIPVADASISGNHAMLKIRDVDGKPTLWISDLGSTLGTWINGEELREPTEMKVGDLLGFGVSEWRLVSISAPDLPTKWPANAAEMYAKTSIAPPAQPPPESDSIDLPIKSKDQAVEVLARIAADLELKYRSACRYLVSDEEWIRIGSLQVIMNEFLVINRRYFSKEVQVAAQRYARSIERLANAAKACNGSRVAEDFANTSIICNEDLDIGTELFKANEEFDKCYQDFEFILNELRAPRRGFFARLFHRHNKRIDGKN